jgi:hypothetical protein
MRRITLFLVAIGFLFGRVSFGATELIVNGGFESSTVPWNFDPGQGLANVPIVTNPAQAHGGTSFLSMGNQNGPALQVVFQTVSIPTNSILARYTYFFGASSADLAGSVEFKSVVASTNQVQTILSTLDDEFNGNGAYHQMTFDLTAFAGQTVEIAYAINASIAGAGVRTFFAVDDVSLLSFTAGDIPANDNFTNSAQLVTSTKISAVATNVLATKEPGEPKHAGGQGGHSVWWNWTSPSNGVVTISTTNSTFDTLLGVYTGTSISNLTKIADDDDINSNQGNFASQVKISVAAGTTLQIAVDGKSGATGVAQLNLSFVPDTKAPSVSISSPKSGAKLTNSTVLVQGKADDNLGVALVQVRLENAQGTNDYQDADGTNSWTATVNNLIPGPNTIRVRAFDTSSNVSSTASSTVTYVVVSPMTVTITGSGTVSPNLNNELLNVGATFKMTAKPAKGQVFNGWTGDLTSPAAALSFVMQSNMVLQANFVPNPFTPVVGVYQGLFFDTTNPVHQSSGFFNATVASAGSFSAKITLAGKSYSLSGQFSPSGIASNNIVRKGLTPVSAQLQLDMNGGGITGVLSDGVFVAELNAGRVATGNITPAARYTLLIPGAADGVGHPGGDSYGTVTVSTKGGITFSGVLADGTKVSQKVDLLANGQWPFYVPLYSGNGSIFSWLTFTNGASNDITGMVDWFKLPQAGGKIYLAGFTNGTEAAGSAYLFTKGVPVLDFSAGQFWLANGNLANSFTNQIALDSASKVTSTNSALKLTITTSSGLFKGTIPNPSTGKSISVNGVVLQKQNFGGGFFTGTNQTGRVFLGP